MSGECGVTKAGAPARRWPRILGGYDFALPEPSLQKLMPHDVTGTSSEVELLYRHRVYERFG